MIFSTCIRRFGRLTTLNSIDIFKIINYFSAIGAMHLKELIGALIFFLRKAFVQYLIVESLGFRFDTLIFLALKHYLLHNSIKSSLDSIDIFIEQQPLQAQFLCTSTALIDIYSTRRPNKASQCFPNGGALIFATPFCHTYKGLQRLMSKPKLIFYAHKQFLQALDSKNINRAIDIFGYIETYIGLVYGGFTRIDIFHMTFPIQALFEVYTSFS